MDLNLQQTKELDAITELAVRLAELNGFDRFEYLKEIEKNMECNY